MVRDGEESLWCESCLRETPELALVELLKSLKRPKKPMANCPHCGWRIEQVQETALLGCPLCYEVFATDILKGIAAA